MSDNSTSNGKKVNTNRGNGITLPKQGNGVKKNWFKPTTEVLKNLIEWGARWAFKFFLIVTPIFLFLKLFSLKIIKNPEHYFSKRLFVSSYNFYIFISEILVIIVFIVLFIIFYKLIDKFWSDEE